MVDHVNSVGGLFTPSLLRDAGCNVVTINAQLDGCFSRLPESKRETLSEFAATVQAVNVDLGVAHESEAVRCSWLNNRLSIEGVKLFFDDGSVLIRPSGTEVVYRVYAEATKKE